MNSSLPVPVSNADSAPYWEGAKNGRLLVRHCKACDTFHFMPRHLCPNCWSDSLDWTESTGLGTVYSYTVIRRAPLAVFAPLVPYVVALIELEEGVRMMANIMGEHALSVQIGDKVKVMFEKRGEDAVVPQFELLAR